MTTNTKNITVAKVKGNAKHPETYVTVETADQYSMNKLKNGKLEYFVRGEGWRSTKRFTIITIEVPDTEDILEHVHRVYHLYGKEIAMGHLIKNHALCYKESVLAAARVMGGKITAKEQKLFEDALGLTILQCIDTKTLVLGLLISDTESMINHLCRYHGYQHDNEGSISDFVMGKFGKEVWDTFRKIFTRAV